MEWKEEDGTKYKISYSEKLQLENLKATHGLAKWQKRNFYAKLALIFVFTLFTSATLFLFYRLDAVNFFSTMMGW